MLWVNRLERPAGDTARIRIQASDVSLTLAQPSGTSIRNILRAEVVQYLEVNGQIEVQLRVVAVCYGRGLAHGRGTTWR